ncbi:MAG: glycosyltransferase family 2 protein [Pseudomonadota bacterium]
MRSARVAQLTAAIPANWQSRPWDLVDELAAQGALPLELAIPVRSWAQDAGLPPSEVIIARGLATARNVAEAEAALSGVQVVELDDAPPDAALVSALGVTRALELRVVPWRRAGQRTLIAAPSRAVFEAALPALERVFPKPVLTIANRDAIDRATDRDSQSGLIERAETRVAPRESCRDFALPQLHRTLPLVLAALIFALCVAPTLLFSVLALLALASLLATAMLKTAAGLTGHWQHMTRPRGRPPQLDPRELPDITILVALYKETDIATHLVTRLQALDYPRERLEVLLVTEADDATTQATIAATDLPYWMRQVTVPEGRIKTKPRALNFALDRCRGEIIGVYDAEDAPEADQLLRVAAHFASAGPRVACLQGQLDFYNPRRNWIARCFTIEYAAWFRVILPGLARLGIPVPLGGTTLFFRAGPLRKLGGWDAHNVTEDADLGLRLTRYGYRTELVDTVTFEEANCRAWPWVRQRSRWLKGYAVTYLVHMRSPRALLRDLGLRGFIGVQVLFAGTLLQFLLAPVLWSFWLLMFGFAHPWSGLAADATIFFVMLALFLGTELLNLYVSVLGTLRTRHRGLWGWAPTLTAYFPLGTMAMYKGLFELIWRPFYWDKTSHGTEIAATQPGEDGAAPTPPPHA